MSSQVSPTSATSQRRVDEPYIPVEELAQRLDLPLAILLRRIEAGDVPARRVVGTTGSGWGLRLSDLGIDPEETQRGEEAGLSDHAPIDEGTTSLAAEITAAALKNLRHEEPAHEADPRVAQPPSAMHAGELPGRTATAAATTPPPDRYRYSWSPSWHASSNQPAGEARGTEQRPDEPVAILPGHITRYERGTRGPRSEVAGMIIDSRELVSGLLDRWERTLEQRIFIEQRQRFESELNARQNLVKQLQLELQTARAEHAAYAADRDRHELELEHHIADLQRELAATNDALLRRRGGLFHRR